MPTFYSTLPYILSILWDFIIVVLVDGIEPHTDLDLLKITKVYVHSANQLIFHMIHYLIMIKIIIEK